MTDNLPNRFINSLQALAVDHQSQLEIHPDFVCKPDELALDFDNCYRVAKPQLISMNSKECLAAVDAIDSHLERMSGEDNAHLWTDQAVKESLEWKELRKVASDACRMLGIPIECPPPSPDAFVNESESYIPPEFGQK